MNFKDHFSSHADRYAEFRPHYPDSLFQQLASLTPDHGLGWDCATGNGQAAGGLARHFHRVIGTDASKKQILHAARNDRISYCIAAAESAPFQSEVADIVTVAQALHWLQPAKFFAEARRVLKPGGICTAWCYNLVHIDERLDAVIRRFDRDIIGPYWAPERVLVETNYSTIPFPFEELPEPVAEMRANWTLQDLLGFLGTWSSVQKYMRVNHCDPIDQIREELAESWDDPALEKEAIWPLRFRIGRK